MRCLREKGEISMKPLTVLAGSILVMTALAAPVLASGTIPNGSPANAPAETIKQLRAAAAVTERNSASWSQEPLTQADYDAQELNLDRLIERMQNGNPVSSAEINRALTNPDTPY